MNMESITIQDCLDMYAKKGMFAIINDGNVVEFKKECE